MESVNNISARAKARLSANGRIVIPAAIREQLGIRPGDPVLMEVEDGVLRIESYPTRIARIQREFAQFIPPGVSLADELIRERREEARREQEEVDRGLEQDRLRREGKIA
ncbi:MAG: AbrB/MazE/SpoVT family DNA-binding domain-containing protein [Terracidiphilus sp.]